MNERQRHDLRTVQRWMQAVFTHPDGIVAGIASETAQQEIAVAPDDVERVVSPSRTLSSIDRIKIYGSAYYARLLECLGEEFPSMQHAVGEEAFSAFAFGYLQQYPSRSYTLNQLGANFPRYLRESRPDTGGQEIAWPDFLIDLATLERTYSEVFDGPGAEHQRLLQPEDLAEVPPQQWADAKLVPVECLRLLSLRYPAHEYASAVRRKPSQEQEVPYPAPRPVWLVVTRHEFVVRRWEVSATEFALLSALSDRKPLAEAIVEASETTDADDETFAAQLQNWFHNWSAARLFRELELPPSHEHHHDLGPAG